METGELERMLRKDRDTLASVGLGVMAFGVLTVIQAVLLFVTQLQREIRSAVDSELVPLVIAVSGIFILVFLALDILLRVYVWRSALAAGAEDGHTRGCLLGAGLLGLTSLFSLISTVVGLILAASGNAVSGAGEPEELVVIAVIHLTSLVTLIEMIVATVRVGRTRRELAQRRETAGRRG